MRGLRRQERTSSRALAFRQAVPVICSTFARSTQGDAQGSSRYDGRTTTTLTIIIMNSFIIYILSSAVVDFTLVSEAIQIFKFLLLWIITSVLDITSKVKLEYPAFQIRLDIKWKYKTDPKNVIDSQQNYKLLLSTWSCSPPPIYLPLHTCLQLFKEMLQLTITFSVTLPLLLSPLLPIENVFPSMHFSLLGTYESHMKRDVSNMEDA